MKNENIYVDKLLRKALGSAETPEPQLVQRVKHQLYKEEINLKRTTIKRSVGIVAAAVVAFVMLSTTAFAAWYFLKPTDVATRFGDTTLSAAFESATAININQSITSGDYTFTLLATVSGNDLTDHPIYSNGEIRSGRTYAVLAIQKADGSPMPDTSDDAYGAMSFITSPLIKGCVPWQVNAWTMNGGHSDFAADGILYRIVACDSVTMFADRGVYLGVATGSFINNRTFIYDETTGEITANPDYDGASIVFDLPFDQSLADPVAAQKYLDTLWEDKGGEPEAKTEVPVPAAGEEPGFSATFSADLNEDAAVSIQAWTIDEYPDKYPDNGFNADVDAAGDIVITD